MYNINIYLIIERGLYKKDDIPKAVSSMEGMINEPYDVISRLLDSRRAYSSSAN